jgi:hypothetical protein
MTTVKANKRAVRFCFLIKRKRRVIMKKRINPDLAAKNIAKGLMRGREKSLIRDII